MYDNMVGLYEKGGKTMKQMRHIDEKIWMRVRSRVEVGESIAAAARKEGAGVSAAYARARKENWKREQGIKVKPVVSSGGNAEQETVEALAEAEVAVTRALHRAAKGLMAAEANTDIAKAMEPVDRALRLKRELAKESRERGGTRVVVETLMPLPEPEPEA